MPRLAAGTGGRHRTPARCRVRRRPRSARRAATSRPAPGSAPRLQQWIVRHPDVVQHAVNAGGGLFTGLSPLPVVVPDNRTATALLATAYDDGDPVTVRRPDLGAHRPATGSPTRSQDLVDHLSQVAVLSPTPASADNGTIEVQSLDAGTGPRAPRRLHPGHRRPRHAALDPGRRRSATSAPTCARRPACRRRTSAASSTRWHQAGIGPHEPVLLVGHSLGGMEAAALASRDTGFAITDVVTAGSPTAQVDGFPDGVRVLSLEHHGDVVPLLDGADNPDSVEQTTVTFDDGGRPGGRGDARLRPLPGGRGRGRRLHRPVGHRAPRRAARSRLPRRRPGAPRGQQPGVPDRSAREVGCGPIRGCRARTPRAGSGCGTRPSARPRRTSWRRSRRCPSAAGARG